MNSQNKVSAIFRTSFKILTIQAQNFTSNGIKRK